MAEYHKDPLCREAAVAGSDGHQEFLTGLSMLTRGPTEDKLRWTFRLYDIDGDGRIERREMREIIASVYLMLGKHTEPSVEQDTPTQHADKVFEIYSYAVSRNILFMLVEVKIPRNSIIRRGSNCSVGEEGIELNSNDDNQEECEQFTFVNREQART
ncbi:calsenilin [Trichonephila clavipes]|nr:calsenilin [Trichonephila clavipes]